MIERKEMKPQQQKINVCQIHNIAFRNQIEVHNNVVFRKSSNLFTA